MVIQEIFFLLCFIRVCMLPTPHGPGPNSSVGISSPWINPCLLQDAAWTMLWDKLLFLLPHTCLVALVIPWQTHVLGSSWSLLPGTAPATYLHPAPPVLSHTPFSTSLYNACAQGSAPHLPAAGPSAICLPPLCLSFPTGQLGQILVPNS